MLYIHPMPQVQLPHLRLFCFAFSLIRVNLSIFLSAFCLKQFFSLYIQFELWLQIFGSKKLISCLKNISRLTIMCRLTLCYFCIVFQIMLFLPIFPPIKTVQLWLCDLLTRTLAWTNSLRGKMLS